jgi:poly(A) polymerase
MLIERERAAGVNAEPVRRLAALLPADAAVAEAMAARLRLSKRLVKRLASAGAREASDDVPPQALAYAVGREEAVDRLLLSEDDPSAIRAKVVALARWERPRFDLGGGELIQMGLAPGPLVARTLQAIEREWVERGFPPQAELRELARVRVDQALRDSQ